jgi:tetratricopeptide (TPR) repeat protein
MLCAAAMVACLGLLSGCKMMSHPQNANGVRQYQQGQYQQAIHTFHQAIATDDRNPDGFYNLAATYYKLWKLNGRQEDFDQSESYYRQALARDTNHPESRRGLAVLLVDNNRSDEAVRMLESWAVESPNLAAPNVELARLSEEAGNRDAAMRYLQAAATADPYDARVGAALGRMYENSGNYTQALANYQRSMTRDGFQPEVAARIAALKSAVSPTPIVTPPGGTRLATDPGWAPATTTGTRTVGNPTAALR